MSGPVFTTWGSVRGGCKHLHQSVLRAVECIGYDHAGCRSQGGYSDREVRALREGATHEDAARYDPGEAVDADDVRKAKDALFALDEEGRALDNARFGTPEHSQAQQAWYVARYNVLLLADGKEAADADPIASRRRR